MKLEQVYGAITFYLANQKMVDEYIKRGEEEFQQQVREARSRDPQLYQRLDQILKSKQPTRT